MTAKEKKLVAMGAGAGVVVTALVVGLLMTRGGRMYAAEKSSTPSMSAPAPIARESDSGTQPGTTLELTPAEITAAGVQVADVQMAALKMDIDAFGRVEQPEAQLAAVSARIGGRVDKLYVQYTGESVRRGQAVADVYSPEVATAVADYRLAQENRQRLDQSDDANVRTQADALVRASQRKLELWGVSEKQMETPETDGVPHTTLYASASGSVVERKVTQGQYVNAGDTLFTVADLSQVWIKADVYEDQLPQIRRGQEVAITSEALPNRTLHGRVDFIEPQANPQTRTVPVHVHVGNPGMRLLPGMFVSASFVSRAASESIVVPRSAVLDTGTRKIVYVAKPDGVFEAREVTVGAPSEDLYPVTSGLAKGDKVVLSGNFLIDSQAHLSSGMSGMYGGSKEFAANQAGPAAATDKGAASASAAKVDLHVDITSLKAGEDNTFRATVTDSDGKPITDAHVTVTLVMPAMPSMGMPEMKSTAELMWSAGQHAYVGKVQPGMSGSWNVTVEARRNGAVIATVHTHLSAK
ncbi:MAG TPA: efflux RND transporter periplasmic adaptor subunit [Acidobacteriaceae bacterium]|jgi:RND family efflux transporter MFP subunit